MSHYKPYPAYKDSGVEWIGKVPEHWATPALKFLVSTPITDGPHETPNTDDSGDGVLFISAEAVSSEVIDFNKAWGYISRADHERYSRKYRPTINDIYMVKSGATTGITAIVEDGREFNIWSPLAAIRAGERVSPRFLLNALRATSFRDGVALNWSYGTQQNIGMKVLEALPVPLPPLNEQERIVKVLARETTRIDALIYKKTKFIELLAKKRQALITHAVTRGLNPKARMKDSGVEWLGKVPEHWQVRPIKSLATGLATLFIDGDWIESKNLADSGIRYITTGNVGEGEYKEQGSGFISEATFDELRCTEVLPGDVLISRLNPPIGRACIAPNLKSRVVTSVDNVILRPSADFDSMFIVFRFSAKDYFHEMSLLGSGATMQRVSRTELGNVRVAWPPLNEQIEIRRHIQAETMQIDTLLERVGNSIDLLKKRRSALITAAVTGQIDLRDSA